MEEAQRCICSSGHGHIVAREFVGIKGEVARAGGWGQNGGRLSGKGDP